MSHAIPLSPEMLRQSQTACEQFEADLSAFVDEELNQLDAARVAHHVEQCDGCRAFVNGLAEMAHLHAGSDSLRGWSSDALWGDLTLRLLSDNETRLARVLYELGKALIVEGIRSTPDLRGLQVFERQPGSIPVLTRKGRNLAQENRDLCEQTPAPSQRVIRRRGLFPRQRKLAGAAAFECGRHCLEECLRLQPDRQEARIYLGQYHRMMGRYDRARQILRTVLRAGAEGRLQLIAMQQLSWVHSTAGQFARAAESEAEVLARAERAGDELFQVGALCNLAIYAVKLGRFDQAEEYIGRLVNDFPGYLDEVVAPSFGRARDFRRRLARQPNFLALLRERYPSLFGA